MAITGLAGEGCPLGYLQPLDLAFTPTVGDYDEDGVLDLTVKFDRQILLDHLLLSLRVPGRSGWCR